MAHSLESRVIIPYHCLFTDRTGVDGSKEKVSLCWCRVSGTSYTVYRQSQWWADRLGDSDLTVSLSVSHRGRPCGIPLSRESQIFRRNTRFAATVIRPDYQFLPRFGDLVLGLASLY